MPRSGQTKRHTRGFDKLIRGVDLFCGAGGLTKGLEAASIDVAFGVDLDPHCEYPYEANNRAKFVLSSVEDITADDFKKAFRGARYSLIAGCAPCQPFSTYQRGKGSPEDERWNLLQHFGRIVREVRPHLVTMENVPLLERQDIFEEFVAGLQEEDFFVSHAVVNCMNYGVPQHRNRLVLLASRLGPINLVSPTTPEGKHKTVQDVIGGLPPLGAGEICDRDPMHQSCSLSSLNLERIRASKPGGTWRDWDDDLVADCHKKSSGQTYSSVYGRMRWDEPAPTMTTQFYGFGNGRFGHPEQDRAISLREGAIIQSFPKSYKFVPRGAPIHRKSIGRLIGNAVPVNLGKAIGKSLLKHVIEHEANKKQAA